MANGTVYWRDDRTKPRVVHVSWLEAAQFAGYQVMSALTSVADADATSSD